MTFNRSNTGKRFTAIAFSCAVFAAFSTQNEARAEPRPETFHPSGTALAGDQSVFDEGVKAYDAGDYAQAFGIWLPLAKAGDLAAQRNVAHLLRNGLGVDADPARALFFYERAARSGLASAGLNAGMMRLEKDADYYDPEKSAEWLSLAAAGGSPIAQWELARLLETGEGGRKDPQAALLLLQQAAATGHEQAIARLQGLAGNDTPHSTTDALPTLTAHPASPAELNPLEIPTSGQAAPVSPEVGATFMTGVFAFDEGAYDKAAAAWAPLAEQGIIEAQYRLGRLYQFGMGVPRDKKQAIYWLMLAAQAEHDRAALALEALPPVPTP